MKRYSEYKDSGVKWIGEIPEHWECRKLKTLLLSPLQYGANASGVPYSEHLPRYIRITDITLEGKLKHSDKLSLSNEDAAKYILKDKDILFARSGASVGKTFLYKQEYGLSAFAGYLIKAELGKELIPELLFYFTQSDIYESWKNGIFIQSTIQNIGADKYSQLQIALPPLSEQEAIVTYLDSKVAKIDEYISIAEKKIAALEELKQTIIAEAVTRGIHKDVLMKDSGVKWIGMIPEHWKVLCLKYLSKIKGRIGYRGYTAADLVSEGEGAFVIGGKHINQCILNTESPDYISWDKYYESPEIMVSKGDIVMAQRGSLGKVALIDKEINEATINPSLVLIKDICCDASFLYFYLRSNSTLTLIELLNTATAVPMISQKQIEKMPIPLPPLPEQQEIVTYIEAKVASINQLCQAERSQIEKLKEYKQRLISDVVTGKVKVTND